MQSTRKMLETFQNSPIPKTMRAPWAYSALHDPKTAKVVKVVPDLFVANVLRYNAQADVGHQFTHIFSYGGSMEMSCLGSGDSRADVPATRDNLKFYYDDGIKITDAYCQGAAVGGYQVVPMVDGRVDGAELSTFNQLKAKDAALFADIVTEKLFTKDNRIPGAQFDVEPFDITQEGQENFYRQIAKNFASTDFNCKNDIFPFGRYFSVFTFASRVNATLAEIFNQYQNGFVIDSLYDLEGETPPNSLDQYRRLVDREIKSMMEKARTYNIKYQFGIPASASTREYESVNGVSTGNNQIDYVKIALDAIDRNGVRNDPNFMGVNVWGFCHSIHFKPSPGKINFYQPNIPQEETLHYLSKRL